MWRGVLCMKCMKCGEDAVGMVTIETSSDASGKWPMRMEGRCKNHLSM
jgi:hypothetical protein